MPAVLTIAGFDPSSGAGVTADLAVFGAHGLFGTSAITALTSQSTVGVRSMASAEAGLLRETLAMLEEDLPADGIKIGMLGGEWCVAVVVEFLKALQARDRRPVVVLDPVLRSTSGRALLDAGGVRLMREELLPLVDWATPNVEELGVLLDRSGVGHSADAITGAAEEFRSRFAGLGLVVTGGDRASPDDLLLTGTDRVWLRGERVETTATHGTGCAFSSALLSRLVLGEEPHAAARGAKEYVAEAMRRAVVRGRGKGPMNLLWPLSPDAGIGRARR